MKHYFGDKAQIYGVDIDPRCEKFLESQIDIFIGDQENREFLQKIRSQMVPLSLIEDGGHKAGQQIATFERNVSRHCSRWIVLIEDLHTGYWSAYDGSYQRRNLYRICQEHWIGCMRDTHKMRD